jgi:hypothetical protein
MAAAAPGKTPVEIASLKIFSNILFCCEKKLLTAFISLFFFIFFHFSGILHRLFGLLPYVWKIVLLQQSSPENDTLTCPGGDFLPTQCQQPPAPEVLVQAVDKVVQTGKSSFSLFFKPPLGESFYSHYRLVKKLFHIPTGLNNSNILLILKIIFIRNLP